MRRRRARLTENIEKVHRAAAARASLHRKPIMAHSRPASETGPRQLEIFEQEGVDPARVQIAHTGDTADVEYIERLLERGAYVGLDRYGLEMFLPYEQRQTTQGAARARLCAAALPLRRLLRDDRLVPRPRPPSRCSRPDGEALEHPDRARAGAPELREAGVSEEQIETMMVRNPVRLERGHDRRSGRERLLPAAR